MELIFHPRLLPIDHHRFSLSFSMPISMMVQVDQIFRILRVHFHNVVFRVHVLFHNEPRKINCSSHRFSAFALPLFSHRLVSKPQLRLYSSPRNCPNLMLSISVVHRPKITNKHSMVSWVHWDLSWMISLALLNVFTSRMK